MSTRTRARLLAKPNGSIALVTIARPHPFATKHAGKWQTILPLRPGSVLTLIETYASGRLRPARLTGSLGQKLRALVAEPSTDHE